MKHPVSLHRNKDGYISLGELKLANKERPIRAIAEVNPVWIKLLKKNDLRKLRISIETLTGSWIYQSTEPVTLNKDHDCDNLYSQIFK